jgi:hypothetical protein
MLLAALEAYAKLLRETGRIEEAEKLEARAGSIRAKPAAPAPPSTERKVGDKTDAPPQPAAK